MEGLETPSLETQDARVRSALETIHDSFKKYPFTKQMVAALGLVAGAFASSKVEGAEVEDTTALLSAVEFIEQAEEMEGHPEVIESARTLYEYHVSMTNEDASATWQGSMLHQQMHGAGEFSNFEDRMHAFPHSGSGLFEANSKLQEAVSNKGDDVVVYTGFSRHFKVRDVENVQYSEDIETALTITVEVNESSDLNEELVEAIAGEVMFHKGVEITTGSDSTRTETNTDLSDSHVMAIDSKSSAPITWNVQGSEVGEDGVTRYKVVLQFGEMIASE